MTDNVSALVDAAATIAARAANEYLRVHNLDVNRDLMAEIFRDKIKTCLPEALRDAKEALDCNMGQVAEATFSASMANAGIEAAKEAAARMKGWAEV